MRSLMSGILCHDAAMEQLEGKVAVVTGAGSGIGQALVRRFAAEQMRVVAADIEAAALAATVDGLAGTSTFIADVADFDDVDALAEHAYETFGATDVLCNNAGVFAGGLMWERPPSDFAWTLGVNLWGILNGIRAFVPRMLAAGTAAHIVNTVSMAGICTNAFSGPYTVSKFAAQAATECLAHDLRGRDAHRDLEPQPAGIARGRALRGRTVRRAGVDRPHGYAGRAAGRGGGDDRRRDSHRAVPRSDQAELRETAKRSMRGNGRQRVTGDARLRLAK
jgi:NADP-dependent 3-hydroxy acid dehydrogenase YdfG